MTSIDVEVAEKQPANELTVTIPGKLTEKATVLKLVVSTPGAGSSGEANVNVTAAGTPP
jgi:hypothetical protein